MLENKGKEGGQLTAATTEGFRAEGTAEVALIALAGRKAEAGQRHVGAEVRSWGEAGGPGACRSTEASDLGALQLFPGYQGGLN